MSNTENKRIVYIWPENKEFYDSLPNKSELINNHLLALRLEKADDSLTELAKKLKALDERDSTQ